MLILPIKKKWFDMILSGEKKEEYREITGYWTSRINNWSRDLCGDYRVTDQYFLSQLRSGSHEYCTAIFRNGYGKNAPSFKCDVKVCIGTGRQEWGAEPGKEYFVLQISDIVRQDV